MKVPTSQDTTASVKVLRRYWPRGFGQTQRLTLYTPGGKPACVEERSARPGSLCYITEVGSNQLVERRCHSKHAGRTRGWLRFATRC
jgi:hypothetical protein